MNVAIYNKRWVVPAKSGTRYLDKVFNIDTKVNQSNGIVNGLSDSIKKIVIDSNEFYKLCDIDSITHLIIRDPLSMLESAIHTDIWGHQTEETQRMGLDNHLEDAREILLSYLDRGTGHWSPHIWSNLYYYLKSNPNVQIVEMSSLTNFVYNETGIKKYGFPSQYNFQSHTKFKVDYSREHIIDWVKKEFPMLLDRIYRLYEVDKAWYDKIIDREFEEVLPKVKRMKPKII